MNLSVLDISGTKISDLGPLAGMATLETFLALGGVAIVDLGPLKGLPLRHLELEKCAVRDLEPLRRAPWKC